MSRTRRARAANSTDSRSGGGEQLDQRRARRREALGHLGAHQRVEVGRLQAQPGQPRAHPAGGQHEDGQQHEREHGDLPGDGQHGDQREDDARRCCVTTPERVSEKARWAPITSLLSRLTRAPVRVRVKKATGIVCTWSKTARRRSRISVSPIRADSQRTTSPTPGLGDGDDGDQDGQPHDDARGAVGGDRVDDLPGQQRRGDRQERGHHAQQRGTRPAPGAAAARSPRSAGRSPRRTVARSCCAVATRYTADQATPSMLMPLLLVSRRPRSSSP